MDKPAKKAFQCACCLGIFAHGHGGLCDLCDAVVCRNCTIRKGDQLQCLHCAGLKPKLPEEAVLRFLKHLMKQEDP